MEKRKNFLLAFILATAAFATTATGQNEIPLRHIRAIKTTEELTMLDRVESDRYRKLYEYNEYGYITSVKVYNLQNGSWVIDTDESYEQTYKFDDNGQCTERVRYALDGNGQRSKMTEKGALEQEDGYIWERYWSTDYNGNTYMSSAKAYDKWGNLSIEVEYRFDETINDSYIYEYEEWQFSGQLPPQSHYNYQSYANILCTYHVKAYQSYANGGLYVQTATKTVDEISGGILTRKQYRMDYGGITLEQMDGHWDLTGEERYTLNGDGTRPVSRVDGSEYWSWDNLGRLTEHTDGTRTEKYTYADDYAKGLSLTDIINNTDGFYPEESTERYGHLATYHSEDSYGYEDQTAERDGQGRVARVIYKEVNYAGNDAGGDLNGDGVTDGNDTDNEICEGVITFHYRPDGHLSHEIDADDGNGFYYKTEYVYNANGVWTGIREYDGDSADGPWTLWNEQGNRRGKRAAAKRRAIAEDMSEGSHDIYEEGEAWCTQGHYMVENGSITAGYYRQWLINRAETPRNPELNYTDPLIPLAMEDDMENSAIPTWYYEWDNDRKEWHEEYAPDNATRTYYVDNGIKRDTYNSAKEITGTETFTLNGNNDVLTHEWDLPSSTGIYRYAYLAGTDYLESREADITGKNGNETYTETRRYYYSKHNYADPSGINDIRQDCEQTGNGQYYDLQGRAVKHPMHGLYIRNGKKVVVK